MEGGLTTIRIDYQLIYIGRQSQIVHYYVLRSRVRIFVGIEK